MDIERQIEFLVQNQAAHDAKIAILLQNQAAHDVKIAEIWKMHAKNEEMHAKNEEMQAKNEEMHAKTGTMLAEIVGGIDSLARIAHAHERRLTGLEGAQ